MKVYKEENEKQEVCFYFEGDLDENFRNDVQNILENLESNIELHLGKLTTIDNSGQNHWIEFIHSIPGSIHFSLSHCPPNFIDRLNLSPAILGRGQLTSSYIPLICGACEHSQNILIDDFSHLKIKNVQSHIDNTRCEKCQKEHFSSVVDLHKYFDFTTGDKLD